MKKISEGRTAEIFAYDQEKILKLYRNGLPMEAVKYEYEVNQIVAILGVPAPRAYELNRLTKEFAALHYRIHEYELDVERIGGTFVLKQPKTFRRLRNYRTM